MIPVHFPPRSIRKLNTGGNVNPAVNFAPEDRKRVDNGSENASDKG